MRTLNPDKVKNTAKNDLLRDFLECFDNPSGRRVLEHLRDRAEQGFPDIVHSNNTYYMAGHIGNVKYIENVVKMGKQRVSSDKKKGR
jgi:hypothetical protein